MDYKIKYIRRSDEKECVVIRRGIDKSKPIDLLNTALTLPDARMVVSLEKVEKNA